VKFLPSTSAKPDDNIGRGIEFALVVLVFLGMGYLLDRWLGTKPLFMIVLFLFAMAGETVKMWLGYDAKMKQHEADRDAKRSGAIRAVPIVEAPAARRPAPRPSTSPSTRSATPPSGRPVQP
jgi:hypothetical protein